MRRILKLESNQLLSLFLAVSLMLTMMASLPSVAGVTVQAASSTRYTVLVLDVSGGADFQDGKGGILYSADTAIDYVKQAANNFVSDIIRAGGTNYVALVTYDSASRAVSEFSTDSSAIQTKINQIKAGSKNAANIAAGLEQADSLLNGISSGDVIKNVVLFTTGLTQEGSYSYDGHYSSTVGGGWYVDRNGTKIPLYAYANVANAVAEKIKTKANLYSIGLFQNLNDIPEAGKPALALFRLTALDIATSTDYFYDVDDPNQLSFTFGEIADNIINDNSSYSVDIWARPGDSAIKGDLMATYRYSDNLFSGSSYNYKHDLARLSIGMATAAFSSKDSDENFYDNAKLLRASNILNAYAKLGFTDSQLFDYEIPLSDASNKVAFSIAQKNIFVDNEAFTLIAVVTRGGGYGAEWGSNFNMGDGAFHEGFNGAAQKVTAEAVNYIVTNQNNGKISSKIKLWITGYSRGGAVANLASARLGTMAGNNLINIDRKNIFTYTFATPKGVRNIEDPREGEYGNIFNIISPSDLVPTVALSHDGWNFDRYGVDKFLPNYVKIPTPPSGIYVGPVSSSKYMPAVNYYKKLTGQNKYPNLAQPSTSNNIGDILHSVAPTTGKYNENLQVVVADCVAILLGMADGKGTMRTKYDYLYSNRRSAADAAWTKAADMVRNMNRNSNIYSEVNSDESLWTLIYAVCDMNNKTNITKESNFPNVLKLLSVIFDVKGIMPAHFNDVYVSWLMAFNEDELFNENNGKSKKVRIACPVDVNVYDNNNLVASVVNDRIVADVLPVEVIGDEKEFYLYGDNNYRIEITATDNGKMDYSVTEYVSGDKENGNVKFNNLTLQKGMKIIGEVNGSGALQVNNYQLTVNYQGDTKTIRSGEDTGTFVSGPTPFTDVYSTDWFYETVNSVYSEGLMVGTSATTFNPRGNITIAEAITMAARTHAGGDSAISNSGGVNWYDRYVDYVVRNGIIKSYDFSGYNVNASRAQMAYIFSNVIPNNKQIATSSLVPPDIRESDEYGKEIYLLYRTGILMGNDDAGTFAPNSNIIRAEAAAIILRVHLLLAETTATPTTMSATDNITSVSVSPTAVALAIGDTRTFTAAVYPSNAADTRVIWESSNTNVATVSSSGVVTARAEGISTITATSRVDSSKYDSVAISVTGDEQKTKKLTSITVKSNPFKTAYNVGDMLNTSGLSLTLNYDDSSSETVNSGFTCSPTTMSTAGNQIITVTYQGKTATFSVSVQSTATNIAGVSVSPASLSMPNNPMKIGETYILTAAVSPSNASDKSVTWSSSNTSVATVSSSGVVTAKGSGMVTITATSNADSFKKGTCSITVVEDPVSFTLNNMPTKTTYTVGETFDTAGLTFNVKWNSGNTEVINGNNSLLTYSHTVLNTVGTQTITATYSGYTPGATKTTFNVTVTADEIESVKVETPPSKTTYYYGDELDTRGLSLKVTYKSKRTEIVTSGFTCSALPQYGVVGGSHSVISVSYSGFSGYTGTNPYYLTPENSAMNFDITMKRHEVTSVTVTKMPTKTSYRVGDTFDSTGLEVTVGFDSGKTKTIGFSGGIQIQNGISFSPATLSGIGTAAITVTYDPSKVLSGFGLAERGSKATTINVTVVN